jgi:signal transduction histidine kinase
MKQVELRSAGLPPDRATDGALIASAALIGAVLLVLTWPKGQPAVGALEALAGVVACGSLLVLRARPVLVALLTMTLALVSPMAIPAAAFALTGGVRYLTLRTYAALAAYVVVIVGAHIGLHLDHTIFLSRQPNAILVVLLAIPLALVGRTRVARAEAGQRERLEEARVAERRRIAREMHDVLAHRISMVSLHAGALEFHPDAPPEEIATAAGVIRDSAHAALGELREVISLLRSPADGAEGSDNGSIQRPQPTLADLPQLIDESRQAGMRIGFEVELARPEQVPYALGRTVYRIVQEGLTNGRKHAPAGAVQVLVADDDGGALAVSVVNGPADTPDAAAMPAPPGSGTGLIGLAERVALAGGRLEHGPTPDGGYVLRATLPVPQ